MKNNKDRIVERALQDNFKTRSAPGIPADWRAGLKAQIDKIEAEQSSSEEVLFIKYENSFWRLAWISFAASVFIFISLMYLLNKNNFSLEQTVSRQMYECLSMENEL